MQKKHTEKVQKQRANKNQLRKGFSLINRKVDFLSKKKIKML